MADNILKRTEAIDKVNRHKIVESLYRLVSHANGIVRTSEEKLNLLGNQVWARQIPVHILGAKAQVDLAYRILAQIPNIGVPVVPGETPVPDVTLPDGLKYKIDFVAYETFDVNQAATTISGILMDLYDAYFFKVGSILKTRSAPSSMPTLFLQDPQGFKNQWSQVFLWNDNLTLDSSYQKCLRQTENHANSLSEKLVQAENFGRDKVQMYWGICMNIVNHSL